MWYRQPAYDYFKTLVILPLCLLGACATDPVVKKQSSYSNDKIPDLFYQHIDDDEEVSKAIAAATIKVGNSEKAIPDKSSPDKKIAPPSPSVPKTKVNTPTTASEVNTNKETANIASDNKKTTPSSLPVNSTSITPETAATNNQKENVVGNTTPDKKTTRPAPPALTIQQRMPRPDTGDQIPSWISNKKYTFKANRLEISEALSMFSRVYGINIYSEPEVSGEISVSFNNLPLKTAMEVIIGAHDFYWQWQDNLIYVGKFQTKTFHIDYIRLIRTGSATSNTSVTSQGESDENSGTSSTITQGDKISFWDELETQLKSLLGKTGRLTINKTTGNIQVTDTPHRLSEIDQFISDVKNALHRQVIIEARIFEVQLNDDNRLGVDWAGIDFLDFTAATATLNGLTNGGLNIKTATANVSYNDGRFQGLINVLSEQGNVTVMSHPRIRTLNNQPAIIKVGTDRTFFSNVATSTSSASGTQVISSEKPTVITEGVVLSITPQISSDSKIILDVSPVITRIADVTVSKNGSTAPVLDIKQTSTLVQALNGEMVVVGGLIQDVKVDNTRKVPLLGSIPLIGWLFRSESQSTRRTELVICLIPKIIGYK